MGAQGTQNGGIDGAPLASTIPGGVRELLAENLLAVWLDLECASGNDARHSESEIRVGAKITPYLLAGSDLICSGFGTILKYDNSFNPSSFNGEELEDFLVLQRDFEADGGLRSVEESSMLALRQRAVDALEAVFDAMGLAVPTSTMKQSVVVASGSNETETFSVGDVGRISSAIQQKGITILDVIKVLHQRGFRDEAENLLFLLRLKLSGDFLQTSALIRDQKVLSAVNRPNQYLGPGTGYRVSAERLSELAQIRGELDKDAVISGQAVHAASEAKKISYRDLGDYIPSSEPKEVVVAISPAFGTRLFQTLAGHSLADVLRCLGEGIEAEGMAMRVIRCWHSADTSFLGLTAARLSGSGIGIGIQAKGTAVIHKRGRLPHNNLELFSNAPITSREHYQRLGANAAIYARGDWPEPVIVTNQGEALGARFHARVALIYAIETAMLVADRHPQQVAITFLESSNV